MQCMRGCFAENQPDSNTRTLSSSINGRFRDTVFIRMQPGWLSDVPRVSCRHSAELKRLLCRSVHSAWASNTLLLSVEDIPQCLLPLHHQTSVTALIKQPQAITQTNCLHSCNSSSVGLFVVSSERFKRFRPVDLSPHCNTASI